LALLDDITDLAVEVQWDIVKDDKDITILCALKGSPFDAQVMQDTKARDYTRDELDTLSVHREDESRVRSVEQCLTFGFAGTDGIEAKCLVVISYLVANTYPQRAEQF
jgi:hypothetical protein